MLKVMTVTGADNSTPINDLIALQKKYPFLEFGFLISHQHAYKERFPSWRHLATLSDLGLEISLHVCGNFVQCFYEGDISWTQNLINAGVNLSRFGRIQFNTHGREMPQSPKTIRALDCLSRWYGITCIQQLDGANKPIEVMQQLFDRSHGGGIVPDYWPRMEGYCGYAGGLGPHNLRAELPLIDKAAMGNYWIDMETHVRRNGRLDLNKVEHCAEICKEVMEDG